MAKVSIDRMRRLLWRRCNTCLSSQMKERILAARRRFLNTKPSSTLADRTPDQQHLKDVCTRWAARARGDDGMRDYPNTRPHLSIGYLTGLIRWLAQSDFKVMSYRDLAEPLSIDNGQAEFARWIDDAVHRQEKAVLLQYDVDARPDVTFTVLKTHIELGVPANVMLFRRKIFDWKLKREGVIEFDEYPLDYDTLHAFEEMGGVIGYHCNAFDRSEENDERAVEIFFDDIAELRKHFNIEFFSMHGGHVTPDGKCNATIPICPHLNELGLSWVHNGRSADFHANWADGGASNPLYRKECSDLLDFLLSTHIGQRTRLLFHPQYYNDDTNSHFDFPIIQDSTWVQEARSCAEVSGLDGEEFWNDRITLGNASIDEFDQLFEPIADERPVFINGMSRSGTTLLVSMFDAHPDGAMAYESYPRYLHVPSDDGVLTMEEFTYTYQTLLNYDEHTAFNLLDRAPLRNLLRFAAVTSWTGMSTHETGKLLRAYLTKHHRVSSPIEALKIVAATARFKLRRESASFWGTKCQGNFTDYFTLWPKARLIYIMRNGLDILASQMTNGSFKPDPLKLGRQWVSHFKQFEDFRAKTPKGNFGCVIYDRLVKDPASVTRALCDDLGFSFHQNMLQQHEAESTLTRTPRGQLSAERVQQPIDTSSIGRWKRLLSDEDIEQFMAGCEGPGQFERYDLDWRR